MKRVIADPARVGSTAPQEIPGFGHVPATLDELGMTEADVKAAAKRGVPVIIETEKEEA